MHCDDNLKLKNKLLTRLKRIEGQVKAIQKMVENDEYCIDIITQSSAARGALLSFESELLENHFKTCVVNLIKSGKAANIERAAKELTEIYKNSHKR